MRLMHLLIAASVLSWIGCGGPAPSGDENPTPAAADGHSHDHGAADYSDDDELHPVAAAADRNRPVQPADAPPPLQPRAAREAQSQSTETPAVEKPSEPAPPVGNVGSTGLAAQHAATTLVGPGDKLPDLTVTDLEGKAVSISDLQKDARVLVLVFWDSQTDLAKLELEYLQKEIAEPRAEQGVRVVAINRGDPADAVRQVMDAHGVAFPVLLDTRASAFGKLATRSVPRTYVIDSNGTVRNLWVGFTGQGTISEIQKEVDAVLAKS